MNWRRGRNDSPPGTGGVARSAGVVDESNNSPPHSFSGIKKTISTLLPPRPFGPPLLFQEGSRSFLSSNSFTPSVTAPATGEPALPEFPQYQIELQVRIVALGRTAKT